MVSFPERLKELREEHSLLQRELAEKLNLSRVTITHYEQGKRFPDRDTLQKIADLFNVSIDYLLGRTDNKENKPETLAAHRTDDPMADLPPEARKSLEEFIENMKKLYGKKE